MTVVDRRLLADLARVLRLLDPVPPPVERSALRAGELLRRDNAGDHLGRTRLLAG